MLKVPRQKKSAVVTDPNLARLPGGAIIDAIEFFGIDNFASAEFNLGLGALNHAITTPLVVKGTKEIANSPGGGIIEYATANMTGENDKIYVANDTTVNFSTTGVVTGGLRVDVFYHVK